MEKLIMPDFFHKSRVIKDALDNCPECPDRSSCPYSKYKHRCREELIADVDRFLDYMDVVIRKANDEKAAILKKYQFFSDRY